MAEINRSIDVDAAIGDVDQEWTQFMFRTLVGHYQEHGRRTSSGRRPTTLRRTVVVLLEGLRDDRTRVSVTVEFEGDEAQGGRAPRSRPQRCSRRSPRRAADRRARDDHRSHHHQPPARRAA